MPRVALFDAPRVRRPRAWNFQLPPARPPNLLAGRRVVQTRPCPDPARRWLLRQAGAPPRRRRQDRPLRCAADRRRYGPCRRLGRVM